MSRRRKKASIQGIGQAKGGVEKAQKYERPTKEEDIDVQEVIRKQRAIERRNERAYRQTQSAMGYNAAEGRNRSGGVRSIFYDPLMLDTNRYGPVRTISPYYGRQISYKILRAVSQKAWILNICILNIIRKVRPYLKLATSENQRGFRIKEERHRQNDRGRTG
jgi:hypothetical protein